MELAAGALLHELPPGVEQNVEALPPDLHLPVPGHDRRFGSDSQLRAHRPTSLGSPCLRVDRVHDVRQLSGRDAVRTLDALELPSRPDHEPFARANRQRPKRPLESTDLVVGPLERPERRDARQTPDGNADVEARILVLLTEERVAVLLAEKLRERAWRGCEIRGDMRRRRAGEGTRVATSVEPAIEPTRAQRRVCARGREESELGSGRPVNRGHGLTDTCGRAYDHRAHSRRGKCCGVAEHPASDELVPKLLERNPEPVEEVHEDVPPRQQHDGRMPRPPPSGATCHVGTQGDNVDSVAAAHPTITSPDDVRAIRRSRRRPALTQFDYLHLRALVAGLTEALAGLPAPVEDVLDIWCGSRPYDDLLPPGARCVGLDVEGNPYGVADVVSNEFLPFPDEAFDLVMCIQSFHYMADPAGAVAEIARVLRPGGSALVSSVLGFEYDRRNFEARYTEHELRALFGEWEDVRIRDDGGRTVTWSVLTGSLLHGLEQRVTTRAPGRVLRPAFLASYALVNTAGRALQRIESDGSTSAFPMNLTLTARKPLRA